MTLSTMVESESDAVNNSGLEWVWQDRKAALAQPYVARLKWEATTNCNGNNPAGLLHCLSI